MTTKPKAKRFRIRRGTQLAPQQPREAAADQVDADTHEEEVIPTPRQMAAPERTEDGFGDLVSPTSSKAANDAGQRQAEPASIPAEADPAAEIAAIRKEGLTGRQLRMARRIAQKHGLAPSSDYDAVRLLRRQGINPFQHSNMLELVNPVQEGRSNPQNLPQPIEIAQVPAVESEADHRAREILRIQRDIARRRRRALAMLFVRLFFFVALPTAVAGWYYFRVATPMYATNSEFVIQQADGGSSPLGGLFSGTGFATSQDSITVQSYLQSRDAMLRLDADHGFKSHFQSPWIDPLQRLAPDATNEDAYKTYKKNVKISYDPTEGIIKMEVIAADSDTSVLFSEALIGYAEEQVDQLTQRLREDQMAGARESFEDAEEKMLGAQQRVLQLQEARGVLSAEAEVSMQMSQISAFELELKNEQLRLDELLANEQPQQTRVEVIQRNIANLEELIAEMRAELTESDDSGSSLARITGELLVAEADLTTRQMMLSQALQQMETARIEANKQVRYLSLGVSPVGPDEATYPRAFENTILALLIFSGIYLMVSITASILREQVAS